MTNFIRQVLQIHKLAVADSRGTIVMESEVGCLARTVLEMASDIEQLQEQLALMDAENKALTIDNAFLMSLAYRYGFESLKTCH